jgi:hypothetical protein
MKDPQELYWELKKEYFDNLKAREESEEYFSTTIGDLAESRIGEIGKLNYEEAIDLADGDELIADLQGIFLEMNAATLDIINMQLDELNEEHGPLKEFHPDLIDAIFTSDIPPLWPDHKTMQ